VAGSDAVDAWRSAVIFRAWRGWTRLSFSPAVRRTAGYLVPFFTLWYGE